jgi:hypothetical protein
MTKRLIYDILLEIQGWKKFPVNHQMCLKLENPFSETFFYQILCEETNLQYLQNR